MRDWSPGWMRGALVLGGLWETPLPVCLRAQRLRGRRVLESAARPGRWRRRWRVKAAGRVRCGESSRELGLAGRLGCSDWRPRSPHL